MRVGAVKRFTPTHEIVLIAENRERRTIPVMLVHGAAYTRDEWRTDASADWEAANGAWHFQGKPMPPPGYASYEVKRLGRGSDPKHGTPGKSHTIRVPDAIWTAWQQAAKQAGKSVASWLIDLTGGAR